MHRRVEESSKGADPTQFAPNSELPPERVESNSAQSAPEDSCSWTGEPNPVQFGPNSESELARYRDLVRLTGRGDRARRELGQQLANIRSRWPNSGPKASGWTDFLQAIGRPKSTANRYIQLASDKPKAPPAPKMTLPERANIALEALSFSELRSARRYIDQLLAAENDGTATRSLLGVPNPADMPISVEAALKMKPPDSDTINNEPATGTSQVAAST